ncbi:MAG: hypothetical protein V4686_00590 [Patescibacteria group bacterium]
MKYLFGIVLLAAVGYMTYSYMTAENPKTDTTEVKPDFNGMWSVNLLPRSGASCSPATAQIRIIQNIGKTNLVTKDGVSSAFSITVTKDGIIRNIGSANILTFEGEVLGGIGEGKWSDKYGCAGSFTMKKSEADESSAPYGAPKTPSNGQENIQIRDME